IEKDNGKGYFNPDDIQVQSNENFKEIKAGYASSYKNLADIYASKNDFKNSAYYYEKAVNLFNDNFSKEQKFEIYMRRGVALLNAKVYQEALESFREAEKISPKNEKVLLFLIISYEKIGMIKEALDMTKSALKIYPDNEDFSSLFVNILRTYPEATKF
ncbi:MAG: TPR domain-containing protein, partial [Candidatus Moranbacteria bacterium GW2011_GWF2_37_7]